MLRFLLLILLLLVPKFVAAQSYQKDITRTVQSGLASLGYEVGAIDGAWGGKSRKAANELRAKHGLPEAQTLTGSTLSLIHRLAPSDTTLPRAGELVINFSERKKFLSDHKNIRGNYCLASNGGGSLFFSVKNPKKIVDTWSGKKGYISAKQDWYSKIGIALVSAQASCVSGQKHSCREIVEFVDQWSGANALKFGARPGQKPFEDISWIINDLLKKSLFAYSIARQEVDVDPVKEATYIDWFFRRVSEGHFVRRSGKRPGHPHFGEASNHALAHVTPAGALGALIGDRSMLGPMIKTWELVLDTMRKDGSFPTETRRGARALHYTHLQLGQVLSVYSLLQHQGIEFDDGARRKLQIKKALKFALDATENFKRYTNYAKQNHGSGSSSDYTIPWITSWHYGWLGTYRKYFGNDENLQRLSSLEIDKKICSKKAINDDKLKSASSKCSLADGKPLNLWKNVQAMGIRPSHAMGYPANCFHADQFTLVAN